MKLGRLICTAYGLVILCNEHEDNTHLRDDSNFYIVDSTPDIHFDPSGIESR